MFADDPLVDQQHCIIEEQAGTVVLTDLGSRTGVFVRIRGEQELVHGDELLIGRTRLVVDLSSAVAGRRARAERVLVSRGAFAPRSLLRNCSPESSASNQQRAYGTARVATWGFLSREQSRARTKRRGKRSQKLAATEPRPPVTKPRSAP